MSDQGPPRLRDDPEFLAHTGLRFDDEQATAATVDVDAGRAALEAVIAQGTTSVMGTGGLLATTASKVVVSVAVAATVSGVALWSAVDGGPDPSTVSAPPAIEVVAEPEPPPTPAPPVEEVEAPAVVEPASPAETEPAEREVAPKPAPRKPSEARSTLPKQLALYDKGKAAMARGDHKRAIAAFESYTKRFPKGSLRREARLSMLEALVRSGQLGGASTLARRLLAGGGLGKRTGDVRRVLGEAQAKLGRCDAAASTLAKALQEGAGGLSQQTVEAAVAHCRSKQGVTP